MRRTEKFYIFSLSLLIVLCSLKGTAAIFPFRKTTSHYVKEQPASNMSQVRNVGVARQSSLRSSKPPINSSTQKALGNFVEDGTSADTDIDTDIEHFGKDVQKNFQSRDVSVPDVLVKTNNQHNSATHSNCFPSTTTSYSSLDPLANKGSIRKFSSIRRNTKDSVAQEDVNEIQKLSEFPQYGDFMYYANDAVFNGVCGLCDAMIRDNAEVFAFHPRAAGNLSKHMYHPDCVYKAWKAGKPLPGQCPTCKTPVPLVSRVHAVIQIICRTLDKDRLEKRMKEWFSLGQSSNHWLVALDVYVRHAVYLKQTQKIIPFFDWWNRKHNNYPEIEVFPLVINKLRYEEKVQAEFLVKWVDKIVIVLQAALDIYEKFILFPDENAHENNYDTLVIEQCSKATRKNTAKVRKNGPASTDDCPVQSNTLSQARNSPTRPSSTYSPSHYSAKPAMILTADSIDSPNDPYTEPMKFLIDQLDYIVVSGEGLQGVWVKVQKTYLKHQELIARCNSAYRIRELIARNCPLQQDVMNRLLKSEANCLLILQNGAFHLISKYFDAEPMATLLKTTAQYDKFIWYSLNQRSDISILKVMAKYITKFSSEEIVEKFNFDLSIQRNIPYLNIILREISDCAFLVKIICDRFDETEWSKVAVLYTTLVELKCPIAVTYLLYHFMPSVEWNEYPAESAERTLLNSFTEVMEHVCLLLLEKRAAYLGKSLSLTSISHPVVENYYDSLTCNYNPTLDLERIWNECTSVSISMMPNFSKWFVIALVGTGSHDRDDFLDEVRKLAPVLPGKFLAHQKRASISQNQQILVRNMVIEKGSLQYSASLCEFVVEMDKVVSELK